MDKEEQVTAVTVIMTLNFIYLQKIEMLNSHNLFTMKGIFAKKDCKPIFLHNSNSLIIFLCIKYFNN